LTLREAGQVELLGRRPTDLARVQSCALQTDSVNTILASRRFHFQKHSQYFFGTHDNALSVTMRVDDPDCSPFNIQS